MGRHTAQRIRYHQRHVMPETTTPAGIGTVVHTQPMVIVKRASTAVALAAAPLIPIVIEAPVQAEPRITEELGPIITVPASEPVRFPRPAVKSQPAPPPPPPAPTPVAVAAPPAPATAPTLQPRTGAHTNPIPVTPAAHVAPAPAPAPQPAQHSAGVGAIILNAALAQIGRIQDCTALVTNAIAAAGINFHGWPAGYLQLGTITAQPQPGDLIYYANGGMGVPHIAVYAGGGMAVHGGWMGDQTVEATAYVGSGPVFIHI